MDDKPFLVLDLNDIDSSIINEIAKLAKDRFDLESVVSAAEELKYIGQLKRVLAGQFREPDDEWVRFLTGSVYDKPFTQRVREQFRPLVEKAMRQFLSDRVNERLKTALGSSVEIDDAVPLTGEEAVEESVEEATISDDRGIETTLEELEGFQIVRAITCSEVDPYRIVHRDTKSYFGILLDDNNRKPLARLHFNRTQKYIGVFDETKTETRYPIEALTDIYAHADKLRTTVHYYE